MIISVVNQKGGVAKTTSVFNIGSILSTLNKKVLLIDLDPQSSLTVAFGIEDKVNVNMYDVLANNNKITEAIIEINENLFIAPSTLDLSSMELDLVSRMSRESVLKKVIKKIDKIFDFILIDCPPSLGLLTLNSLVASDKVIVPVSTDYLAYKGLELITNTVENVREELNDKLEIMGIIATMVNKNTNHSKALLEILKENYNVIGEIKYSVVVKDSVVNNIPLIHFRSNHDTTFEYLNATTTIIQEAEKNE